MVMQIQLNVKNARKLLIWELVGKLENFESNLLLFLRGYWCPFNRPSGETWFLRVDSVSKCFVQNWKRVHEKSEASKLFRHGAFFV